jgi:hypothetical protein
MRRVRIVLTLTLVVVASASARSRALTTHPYSLDPCKPGDAPLLTNVGPFVAGTDLLELPTHTNPVGHAPAALRFQDSSRTWNSNALARIDCPVLGRARVGGSSQRNTDGSLEKLLQGREGGESK